MYSVVFLRPYKKITSHEFKIGHDQFLHVFKIPLFNYSSHDHENGQLKIVKYIKIN